MLEAAVARPQQTVGGFDAYASLPSKAAALTHSLILNHPFRDGNKRTGILSGLVFMEVNGRTLHAERDGLYTVAMRVQDRSVDLDSLAGWYDRSFLPLTETEMAEIDYQEQRREWYGEHFDDA